METLESLRRRIGSAEDMHSVVRTMKTLAAVNIRHFERAVGSLDDYNRTIEMGLSILLRERPGGRAGRKKSGDRLGVVIFGSEQGLAGQFNDQIVSFAAGRLSELGFPRERRTVLALGDRVVPRIEEEQPVSEQLPLPNSLAGISGILQGVLSAIEKWRFEEKIEQVILFYNRPAAGSSYRQEMNRLLPVDEEWMRSLEEKKWESRSIPMVAADWEQLFAVLIRQYLFVSLYRAFVHSMASENASRLASMQAAEKNIRERLEELTAEYHHQRQSSVTEELMDVIAGYEAMEGQRVNR